MKGTHDSRKTLARGLDQRSKFITHEAFEDLKQALEDALAFELGQRRDLNVTRIKAPRTKSRSSSDIVPNRQKPDWRLR